VRFFRHGEALAIVLPESVRKASDAQEGDEYEFLQLEPGTFLLINKKNLEGMAKAGVVAEMAKKLSGAGGTSALAKPASTGTGAVPAGSARSDETTAGAMSAAALEPEKILEAKGYMVVEYENEAKRVSQLLERKIKNGEIFGIRGFDKKFYILSRQFYSTFYPRIVKAIAGKQSSASDIAESLKLSEPACIALLQMMKENGEIIEKRKGAYELVK
jgi:biotin operon repressor